MKGCAPDLAVEKEVKTDHSPIDQTVGDIIKL